MFLAKRFRAIRVLSVGAASATVLATALVAAVPAQGDDVYPRPWDSIVTLSGHGYGHGHGMSQWGANGAAAVGKLSWQNILAFYYPGTTLTKLANTAIRVRLDAVGHGTLYVFNDAGLQLTAPGGTPVAMKQLNDAGQPITRYRVLTPCRRPPAGRCSLVPQGSVYPLCGRWTNTQPLQRFSATRRAETSSTCGSRTRPDAPTAGASP